MIATEPANESASEKAVGGHHVTMGSEASPLRVFISYSHDSPEHADRVLALADRLRQDGLDCILDQYILGSPDEGWPLWMDRQVRDADFVLMICTPTYYRRVMGEEQPGVGHGVNWEGNLIYQHFYKDGSINKRFLPILLEGASASDIPVPFQGVAKYRSMTEEGYEALYRRLTNQPLTPKPNLGTLRQLPPRERPQQVFENSQPDGTQEFIENVPYERNAFFTGREPLLRQLHEMLHRKGSSALSQPQALSGLGGIGKTQTALEYSYRYRHEYHAIFWLRAESEAALNTSYTEIAKRLALPEQEAPDADKIIQAVKHWVEQHEQWLLIFDNADTPTSLKRYLPRNTTGKGHLLLTSRAQVFDILGIARPMEVQEMQPEEALAFLLKRTGRDEPESHERTAGEQLAKELGYLPLALEQSSAYILEKKARFQDYLASYRKQRLTLLNKAQPKATDYPESVETTWAINFREVEKEPAAADILRLSAFLGPDHIPLELLTKGAGHLGPVLSEVLARAVDDPLVVDETLEPLTRYSLIHRDVDAQTYSLHRLVQEVVKDKMDAATRQLWAERAVRMVEKSFPFHEDAPWPLSQRYLLHALECVTHIKQHHMAFFEAGHLLNSIGVYFWSRGQYEDVEPLYQQAQTIMEQVEGSNTRSEATSLIYLALLYWNQGKYEQAEPLYQRALAIQERVLGEEHPDTAMSLNNLALLYWNQGKYEQAEPLHQRALAIYGRVLGAEHPNTATSLHNLANLYTDQGKYEQAEPLYQRALAIRERALGAEHPHTAQSLEGFK